MRREAADQVQDQTLVDITGFCQADPGSGLNQALIRYWFKEILQSVDDQLSLMDVGLFYLFYQQH